MKTIVEEWMAKEIIIPKHLTIKSAGVNITNKKIQSHRYNILVYVDSVGCTSCNLGLAEWKAYIDKSKLKAYNVGFLFVVQSNNYTKFEQKLKYEQFSYPIIYDPQGTFNKLNKFPKENKYRTFLLDEKNKVVLIGSPIKSENMCKLYDEVISGEKRDIVQSDNIENKNIFANKTTVKLESDSINFGKFSIKSIKQASFKFTNTGKHPFLIQSVTMSCGCTVAKYDKRPIPQGDTTTIVVKYKPYSLGYFTKMAVVICNVENKSLKLKISGEVIKK